MIVVNPLITNIYYKSTIIKASTTPTTTTKTTIITTSPGVYSNLVFFILTFMKQIGLPIKSVL